MSEECRKEFHLDLYDSSSNKPKTKSFWVKLILLRLEMWKWAGGEVSVKLLLNDLQYCFAHIYEPVSFIFVK